MNQPFRGDYLEISKNPKYQKLNSVVDEKVLLADVVNKINRANGKVRNQRNALKRELENKRHNRFYNDEEQKGSALACRAQLGSFC